MPAEYTYLVKILIAMLTGLLIGAEREYRSKPAGLRTLMLVSVGSCIFTILSEEIGLGNPDRIAANIITGIGFLGAGAIFKDDNKINGLTTACTIWVCAALGMSAGGGYYILALAGTLSVLFILSILKYIENYIDRASRTRDYRIVCIYTNTTLENYEKLFKEHRLKITRGTQTKNDASITGYWKLTGSKKNHETVVNLLLNDPAIKEIDF